MRTLRIKMRTMVIRNGHPLAQRSGPARGTRNRRDRLPHGFIWGRCLQGPSDMRKTCSVRNHFVTNEAKKKLLRPCREARVLGL